MQHRKTIPTKQFLATAGLTKKHLRFCEFVATGQTVAEAFFAAGFTITNYCSPERVYQMPSVRGQIDRLRRIAEVKTGMTREELAGYLMSAIRTPISDISPTSPLCAEYTVDELAGPDRKSKVTRTRLKSVSKLDAAKQLIQLMGWAEPDRVTVDAGPNMLAQLEERAKHLVSSLNRAGCVDV